MARIQTMGAELADQDVESTIAGNTQAGAIVGTITLDTIIKRSGRAAYRCASGAANYLSIYQQATNLSAGVVYSMRVWYYLTAYPNADLKIFRSETSGTESASIIVTSTGQLKCGTNLSSAGDVPLNQWFCLQWQVTQGASALDVYLNGVLKVSSNSATVSLNRVNLVGNHNNPAGTFVLYMDDIAFNDDTGSDETGLPSMNGRVVALVPVSDLAVGANWVLGNNAAPGGNAWGVIDERTTPDGIAAATPGSDATRQIENRIGSTAVPASQADFTCQNYSDEAGAGAILRTIVRPVVVIADNVNSNTVDCILSTVTPSGSEITAATPSAVAGTYPTGWTWASAACVYDLGPTFPAPVLRVRKGTANTNRLMVCSACIIAEVVFANATKMAVVS